MSSQPDLTLPATAPSVARYQNEPMKLQPAALYTLVDLSDAELQELQRTCESECGETAPGSNVRVAPQPKFVNQPLRAVFDYHLQLGTEGTFNPTHFIAAVDEDWTSKGVLLVTLDDDELECKVDQFKTKAEDAGLGFVNLQIGNSDWSEMKENYEIDPNEDDDDDGGGGDNDGNGGGDEGTGSSNEHDLNNHGPDPPSGPPPLGYYIGVYALRAGPISTPADAERLLIRTLEPFASMKKPSEYVCRLQALLSPSSPSSSDIISQAFTLHPLRCRKNPWLQKQMCLIDDTGDPAKHGLVLGRLDWDGVTTPNRSDDELRKVGAEAARQTQRVPFSAAGAVQEAFCCIANGDRAWRRPDDPCFAVFRYGHGKQDVGTVAELLDARWTRRADGEERVVFAPELVQPEVGKMRRVEYSFEEAVERFPALCWEHRFRENFSRHYFIIVDSADVKKQGVLLVRVEWDGDVKRGEEELKKLRLGDTVTVLRVPVGEAYSTLKAMVGGEKAWAGQKPKQA